MTLPARFFHSSHRQVARVLARAVHLGWTCHTEEAYRGKATEPFELTVDFDKNNQPGTVRFDRSPTGNWVFAFAGLNGGDSYPSIKALLDRHMQAPEGEKIPDLATVLHSGATITRERDMSWTRLGIWAIVHRIAP